jgi:hypothetical protein
MSYGACTDSGAAAQYADSAPAYCESEWISPFNYARLVERLLCADPQTLDEDDNKDCLGIGPFDTVISAYRRDQQPREREYLRVDGRVLLDGRVDLKPFYRLSLPEGTSDRTGEGSYRVELRAADGSVLFGRNFRPHNTTSHGPPLPSVIQELVPWVEGTARIVVLDGTAVLAERTVSSNAPTVTLSAPNGGETLGATGETTFSWSATDADADLLYGWLEYSADGGSSWETIGRNVDAQSLTVNLANLAGSTQALVRIRVTDGVNTAVDASDSVFSIARKAPFVGIVSPSSGQEISSADTVTLRGLATDYEDGMLPDRTFVWSSNVDGLLGVGDQLRASLSPGEHVITLSATDSDGQEGQSSVTVRVSLAQATPG